MCVSLSLSFTHIFTTIVYRVGTRLGFEDAVSFVTNEKRRDRFGIVVARIKKRVEQTNVGCVMKTLHDRFTELHHSKEEEKKLKVKCRSHLLQILCIPNVACCNAFLIL